MEESILKISCTTHNVFPQDFRDLCKMLFPNVDTSLRICLLHHETKDTSEGHSQDLTAFVAKKDEIPCACLEAKLIIVHLNNETYSAFTATNLLVISNERKKALAEKFLDQLLTDPPKELKESIKLPLLSFGIVYAKSTAQWHLPLKKWTYLHRPNDVMDRTENKTFKQTDLHKWTNIIRLLEIIDQKRNIEWKLCQPFYFQNVPFFSKSIDNIPVQWSTLYESCREESLRWTPTEQEFKCFCNHMPTFSAWENGKNLSTISVNFFETESKYGVILKHANVSFATFANDIEEQTRNEIVHSLAIFVSNAFDIDVVNFFPIGKHHDKFKLHQFGFVVSELKPMMCIRVAKSQTSNFLESLGKLSLCEVSVPLF